MNETTRRNDYWPSTGYRDLVVGADGRLTLTDAFLRRQLMRPELAPVPESCDAELALHDALVADPRRVVREPELAAIRDADARDNYRIWLAFRQRLADAPSLEAAYVRLFQGDGVDVPPLFVHELTQVLLRHVLGRRAPIRSRRAPPRCCSGRSGSRCSRTVRSWPPTTRRSRCTRRPAASAMSASCSRRTASRCARSTSTCSRRTTRTTTGSATSGTTSR